VSVSVLGPSALVGQSGEGEPWGLQGLADLWALTLGDPGVTIAVLDGPCDLSHPCLAGAAIEQAEFLEGGPARGPAGDHGIHTASIIFGRHYSQIRGIAPRCRGLIIPIFKNNLHGGISPCSQPDLARAIRRAANEGADIINVSGGQFSIARARVMPHRSSRGWRGYC
jgi:subtilisin family serine protease